MNYIPDDKKSNLVHVERPRLPWRNRALTECGLPAPNHPVISRADFIAKVKREGKQRAAMSTCMTCFNTAQSHPTWEENPAGCLAREVQTYMSRDRSALINREMRAIAYMISLHRDDFEEAMEDQEQIVSLEMARSNAPARKPKP